MLPRASEDPQSRGTSAVENKGDTGEQGDSSYRPLFDLGAIDLNARISDRTRLEQYIPHRGIMSLVDYIVWEHPSRLQGVAIKHIRPDEFWVPGHFPSQAVFPGVLMLETAAQFAAYLFKSRISPGPSLVVFLRIEDVSFRNMVKPGDDLYFLCDEIKVGRRRFTTKTQGLVGDRIAFEGVLTGMTK